MNEDETPEIETYSRISIEADATLAGLLKLASMVPTEVPTHAEIVDTTQYIHTEEDETEECGFRHNETIVFTLEWKVEMP